MTCSGSADGVICERDGGSSAESSGGSECSGCGGWSVASGVGAVVGRGTAWCGWAGGEQAVRDVRVRQPGASERADGGRGGQRAAGSERGWREDSSERTEAEEGRGRKASLAAVGEAGAGQASWRHQRRRLQRCNGRWGQASRDGEQVAPPAGADRPEGYRDDPVAKLKTGTAGPSPAAPWPRCCPPHCERRCRVSQSVLRRNMHAQPRDGAGRRACVFVCMLLCCACACACAYACAASPVSWNCSTPMPSQSIRPGPAWPLIAGCDVSAVSPLRRPQRTPTPTARR